MDGYSAENIFNTPTGYSYDDIIILPGFIILLIPLAAIGYLTGITIERTSKFKKSTSLQIIAGISTLVGSIIYSNVFLFSIPGLIGLILGIYLAIYRIRP